MRIHSVYRSRSRSKATAGRYTILDFLHDLRVWANYIDIDNTLDLWGPGYRAFLDANLSTVLFFFAGFSELAFIAQYGAAQYLRELNRFYELVTHSDPTLEGAFPSTSLFQRSIIFEQLGFTTARLTLHVQSDPNAVEAMNSVPPIEVQTRRR